MSYAGRFTIPPIVACFIVLIAPVAAQSPVSQKAPPCVIKDVEGPVMPSCVIQARNNALYIPMRFWNHTTFNRYGLSAFWIESLGRVYINRSGRVVIRDVALMDNGPDDFHHGLVRINRDQMWGYADPSGRIVVPVKYSCALNYKDKYQDIGPLVCVGCRMEQQGDYHACVDGTWFHVDSQGSLTSSARPLSATPRRP